MARGHSVAADRSAEAHKRRNQLGERIDLGIGTQFAARLVAIAVTRPDHGNPGGARRHDVIGAVADKGEAPAAAALHRFCNPDQDTWIDPDGRLALSDGEVTINFGQHKGASLREIAETEPDYLKWILDQDFSAQVRAIVAAALRGEFPSLPDPDEAEPDE